MRSPFATHSDIARLLEIRHAAFLAHALGPYSEEEVATLLGDVDPDELGEMIESRQLFVARIVDLIVGLAGWKVDRIRHVYVDPNHARRGIGTALIRRAESDFPNRTGATEVKAASVFRRRVSTLRMDTRLPAGSSVGRQRISRDGEASVTVIRGLYVEIVEKEILRTIQDELERATPDEIEAYLTGAAHDGTFNRLHKTTRFCQSGREWVDILAAALERVGKRAWVYKEGATRGCWVVESTWRARPPASAASAAYVRGYCDAEGGIPKSLTSRFYIQLVQKDYEDLSEVRARLEGLRIACGSIHNPSVRIDPDYWRFYVLTRSHFGFCRDIGSWHPRKRLLLEGRSEGCEPAYRQAHC